MVERVEAGFVEPMLLLRTDRLPDDTTQWEYQLKFDGYRAIAFKTGGTLYLRSRNNNDFSLRYPAVVKGLQRLTNDTVIDGEVIALGDDGRPSFNALQNGASSSTPILFYVVWSRFWVAMGPTESRRVQIPSVIPRQSTLVCDRRCFTRTRYRRAPKPHWKSAVPLTIQSSPVRCQTVRRPVDSGKDGSEPLVSQGDFGSNLNPAEADRLAEALHRSTRGPLKVLRLFFSMTSIAYVRPKKVLSSDTHVVRSAQMDHWFSVIAAGSTLPADAVEELDDVGLS